MAVLGVHCFTRAFSSCGKWGLLFVVAGRLLTAVASLVGEHRLQSVRASAVAAHGPRSCLVGCGAQAQQWCRGLLFRSMWNLPGSGIDPMSPYWVSGLLPTVPPGSSRSQYFNFPLDISFFLHCIFIITRGPSADSIAVSRVLTTYQELSQDWDIAVHT